MIVELIHRLLLITGCHRHAILWHDHRSSNKDKMTENAHQDRKSERTPTNTMRFQRPRRWNPQAVDSRKVVQTQRCHVLKPPLADLPSSTPASPDLRHWPVQTCPAVATWCPSGMPTLVPTSGAKSFPARRVDPNLSSFHGVLKPQRRTVDVPNLPSIASGTHCRSTLASHQASGPVRVCQPPHLSRPFLPWVIATDDQPSTAKEP